MGWIEAQARYENAETIASRNAEDLVARRVLRGMGFVERQLPELEKALNIRDTYDKPLWVRVRELLREVSVRSGRVLVFGIDDDDARSLFRVETMEANIEHNEILGMADTLAVASRPFPLFLTRIKNTRISLAYFLVRHEKTDAHELHVSAGWLKPPVRFIGEAGVWWIAAQETEHFIRQFGPYNDPRVAQ